MFCVDIFLTNLLGFTKTFMTSESMASESIAHSAFGQLAIESEPIRVRRIIVKYTFIKILRHIFLSKVLQLQITTPSLPVEINNFPCLGNPFSFCQQSIKSFIHEGNHLKDNKQICRVVTQMKVLISTLFVLLRQQAQGDFLGFNLV